jgi:hypothetical protein
MGEVGQSAVFGRKKKTTFGTIVAIIIIAVVVIVAVVVLYEALPPAHPSYRFSAVNLEITHPTVLGGTTTDSIMLGSFAASGTSFTYTLSLSGTYVAARSVTSVSLNAPGFTIVSVSPALPVPLSQGGSVAISIGMSGPSSDYSGVLTIYVVEGS